MEEKSSPTEPVENHTPKQHQNKANLPDTQPQSNHLLQLNKSQTTQEVHSSEPTQNQLSFLVSMINKLREDMGKQIEELKHQQVQSKAPQISPQLSSQTPSQQMSTPTAQQVMLNPYTQALLMNSHLAHRQQ